MLAARWLLVKESGAFATTLVRGHTLLSQGENLRLSYRNARPLQANRHQVWVHSSRATKM